MPSDMLPLRAAAARACDHPWRPWQFEATPAAGAPSRDIYLAAVRASAVLIWLAGARTSQAVADELDEALAHQIPIMAIVLPANDRDALTREVLARVGQTSKWKRVDVGGNDNLESSIEHEARLSLGDQMLRWVRPNARLLGRDAIEAMKSRLRGIGIARWQAAGVGDEMAASLWADVSLGSVHASLLPTNDRRLTALVGDVGAGKTLAAIRHAMLHLDLWLEAPGQPLPVWVTGGRGDSIDDVIAEMSAVQDPRRFGTSVIVDGADESGPEAFIRYVDAGRALTNQDTRTTVLLTLRSAPTNGLVTREIQSMRQLEELESVELMNRAFGLSLPGIGLNWPPAIIDAIKRPLFALLLGRHIASRATGAPATLGQLIDELVTEVIRRENLTAIEARLALMRLASSSTNRDGGLVQAGDLGTRAMIDQLTSTRLVRREGDAIGFSLPIFREWFGASAIETGVADVPSVTRGERQLERWRYPIGIAAAISSRPKVDELFAAVSTESPGLVPRLLGDARPDWGGSSAAVPSQQELGREYRFAMTTLIQATSRLTPVLAPTHDPDLPQLGVRMNGPAFVGAWRKGVQPQDRDVIYDLAPGEENAPTWSWRLISAPSPEPTWPWNRVLVELRRAMARAIKHRLLFVDAMRPEATWAAALELGRVAGRSVGDHWYGAIERQTVLAGLARTRDQGLVTHRNTLIPLDPLRKIISSSDGPIQCPYPGRDAPMGGFIWDGFAPATLVERATLVLLNALQIYGELVDVFYPEFAPRLYPAGIGPYRMICRILLRDYPREQPGLSYYFEPTNDLSLAQLDLTVSDEDFNWSHVDALNEIQRSLRPDVPWLGAQVSHQGLEVFGATPATRLAYDWLQDGLFALQWLERREYLAS